jgi:3-dehydroquinate synthase class II
MRQKTIPAASLVAFAALLEEKRVTAAAAAAAAKAAKVAAEALGLPSESVLLKADDKSAEIAALFTERPVAAIAARVDSFHSFKVTKLPAPVAA